MSKYNVTLMIRGASSTMLIWPIVFTILNGQHSAWWILYYFVTLVVYGTASFAKGLWHEESRSCSK